MLRMSNADFWRIFLFLFIIFGLSGCANLMSRMQKDCEIEPETAESEVSAETPLPQPAPAPNAALVAYDLRDAQPVVALPDGRIIVGGVEKVRLDEVSVVMDARIDSGANTSSMDARDMVEFERDGEKWVRFNLRPNGGEPVTIEKPIKKFVKVSQTNSPVPDRRPVIDLRLQVGSKLDLIEFNLTDRSEMTYPILLGRRFLMDRAVIDISQNYIQDLP